MNYFAIFNRTLFHLVAFAMSYYIVFTITNKLGYNLYNNLLTWQFVLLYITVFIVINIAHEYRQTKIH